MPPFPRATLPCRPACRRPVLALIGLALPLALSACGDGRPRAVDALPPDAQPQTRMLAEVKDQLDALDQGAPLPMNAFAAAPVPASLTGRGFSQVAGQPGHTLNEKRLMAIKAARLEALRDLTEQIHGIRISANSLLRDAVMRNDTLSAHVDGALRGARTVAIEPRGEDGYAVTMELDADTVAYVLRVVGAGA
jgi:outer membrane protein FlgP